MYKHFPIKHYNFGVLKSKATVSFTNMSETHAKGEEPMSISKYVAFATTAKLGSFTKAAEALGYTQSGVSHLIRSLEDELGIVLLSRSRTGVVLTQDGAELLPYIQSLIMAEKVISDIVGEIKGTRTRVLTVGSFSSITLSYLPEIVEIYREKYPEVELHIVNGSYEYLEKELLDNHLDCSFVICPSAEEFRTTVLLEDRMMVVMPETNPLARRAALQADDLVGEPFIMPAEGSNYSIGDYFSTQGLSPRIQFRSEDDYSAVEMVRLGMGITILPELFLRHIPEQSIREIPLQYATRTIGIATNRSHNITPSVRTFLQTAGKVIRSHQSAP